MPRSFLLAVFAWVATVGGIRVTEEFIEQGDAAQGGKVFLSVMSWNVEKMDGTSQKKTTYVNDVVINLARGHKLDVVLLQEAQSCSLLQKARQAAGMECVESTVDPEHEAKMTFSVLGGVILYSRTVFEAAMGTTNRALQKREWRQWLDDRDPAVTDRHGRTLEGVWRQTCSWHKHKQGKGCSSIMSDIPITNSVKLYPKPGVWSVAMSQAFPHGVRAVNVHLFSGAHSKELTDRMRLDRRTFQMRSLLWLTRIWDFNDRHYNGKERPVTVFAGDFNTMGRAEINHVLAPAADFGEKPWVASDSVRTHGGGGYLDSVVLGSRPGGGVTVRSSTEMFDQVSRDPIHSDHNPLIVKIYASQQRQGGAATTATAAGAAGKFAGWGQNPAIARPAGAPRAQKEEEWPTLGGR